MPLDEGVITSEAEVELTGELTDASATVECSSTQAAEASLEASLPSFSSSSQAEVDVSMEAEVLASPSGPSTGETDPTVPAHVKAITQEDIASWDNKSDFSGSYNDLTDKPAIPSIEGLATEQYVNDHHDSAKQDVINDLATIRNGAEKGASAVQTETDPTVPSHVKGITQQDIAGRNAKSEFSGSYNDLTDKPSIPTDYVDKASSQEIGGDKTFTNSAIFKKNINVYYHIKVFDDHDEARPSNFDPSYDIDAYYYNTGIKLVESNVETDPVVLAYPAKSGTFALLGDVPSDSHVNDLIATYMQAHYENGDEGSY